MKLLILGILCCSQVFSQNTVRSIIYDLNIQTPGGNIINLSVYKGRKILFVSFAVDNLGHAGLNFWDFLQRSNHPLTVILISAKDMGTVVANATIQTLSNDSSKNLVLSESVKVKKAEGENQDPILQWLTHADQNVYFNWDVTTNEQI